MSKTNGKNIDLDNLKKYSNQPPAAVEVEKVKQFLKQ
jgi:hypothetical protein